MITSRKRSIVQATARDIDDLARFICDSFADVARRFDLTLSNCRKHPSKYAPAWVAADLERGVRYYILISDNATQNRCLEVYMERLSEAQRRYQIHE